MSDNPFANPPENPFEDESISQALSLSSYAAVDARVSVDLQQTSAATTTNGTSTPPPPPSSSSQMTAAALLSAAQSTLTKVGNRASTLMHSSNAASSPPPAASASFKDSTSLPLPPNSSINISREEELRRREQQLEAREAALRAEQDALRKSGIQGPPNFPRFYPLVYHDIDAEIGETDRPFMHRLFRYWLGTVALLGLNFVTCLALLLSPSGSGNGTISASNFGVSLMYMFFITIASFYLWYQPAYKGYMKENSLYLSIYLVFGAFHFLFAFYMAVGFSQSGSGGLINLLAAFSDNKIVAAVLCVITCTGWVVDGLFGMWLWKEVHAHYRAGGHSLQHARTQAVAFGIRAGAGAGAENAV